MQTFLFFIISKNLEKSVVNRLKECFRQTAKALDSKRLGKQRVEAMQVLNILLKRARINGKFYNEEETKLLLKENSSKNWPFDVPREKVAKNLVKPSWSKHPVVTLWKDHVESLKLYFNCIVEEWIERKYKNNLELEFVDETALDIPPFLTNEEFMIVQQRNMIRKNKEYYSKIFGDLEAKDGYMWYKDGKYYEISN